MPIQLSEEFDGRILIIQASGKLIKADYALIVPEVERLVRQHGKLRLLFDMANFHGWTPGGAWQDFKLGVALFAHIERMAMVGEKKWQKDMTAFCKPFTKATVRYFDHLDAALARKWVGEGVTPAPADAPIIAHQKT